MQRVGLLLAATAALVPLAVAEPGRTLTGWDCCKPACAWTSVLQEAGGSGQVMVCDVNDQPLSNNVAASIDSSCGDSGNADRGFLCSDYQPRPVSEDLSLGFAVTDGGDNCCKCFELQWTEGPAAGKRIQVQVINEGGDVADGRRDFVLLTPGGGVGPNQAGCDAQFGYDWGRQYGGVTRMEECEVLPENMHGGCYWRWNWALGDTNGWAVEYNQIQCPTELTSTSGCQA